jgi:hypothetical protein
LQAGKKTGCKITNYKLELQSKKLQIMIQRLQSVYLAIVVILSCFTLFLSPAGFFDQAEALQYTINFRGISEVTGSGTVLAGNTWYLTVLSLLIPVIALATIFFYKKRILQVRLVFFNIVLMAGYYGLLFIYLWQTGKSLDAKWFLNIPAAFPLVNIVLSFMAIRAIARDEALVKSYDRLR